MGAIGRIAVLFTVVLMFVVMALVAVNPNMQTAMDESLESTYSTSEWTTTDWAGYSWVSMVMLVAVNTVIVLVFSFIGLYAGSMLKRPTKS
jgi:CDP-diglyceride synthetase